jgi:hypothetical protein
MKKIFFLFTAVALMAFSCSKSDDDEVVTQLNNYKDQYGIDIANIITYLKTHKLNPNISDYSKNVNNPELIIETTTESESLWKLPTTGSTYPKLLTREISIESHMTDPYIVYYIVFNEGSTTEKPCPLDEVLVTYRGTSLAKNETDGKVSATEFENTPNAIKFPLNGTIGGWQVVFPMFGKGIFDEAATGNDPNVYTNYGAGIMFLPSWLAYYNGKGLTGEIPAYSPLVFSFQLFNLKRVDNDSDSIMTIDEIIRKSDGSFDYTDTDGDGAADYNDKDDDNDGYPTLNEIKKPTPYQGSSLYYPFNPIIDNPLTTDIDESEPKGIPDKSGDFSTPTRIRRHLDKNAKPPYTTY